MAELALLRRKRATISVPLGDQVLELDGATLYVDYVTLYGIVIDEHFALDFEDAMVVDIGAHKGYYGGLALWRGARHVYSYEPERQNFGALARAARRRAEHWTVERSAIGPCDGAIELHVSSSSWAHSVHRPESGKIKGTQTVAMRRLAYVLDCARAEGRRIACKINAEGYAGEIIAATDVSDWVGVDELWCDFEQSDPVPVSETIAHLAPAGLHVSERSGSRVRFTAVERRHDH